MRKLGCLLGVLTLVCAVPAYAGTVDYGWEDGGMLLGMYPENGVIPSLVTDPVHGGTYSLQVIDNAESGTPQGYVAWIVGLQDGDVVDGSFWRFDDTPGASPSCRIWGHYTQTGGTIDDYAGSASGNGDYGLGEGWDETGYSWTFDSDGGARDGLVIEVRTYSSPGDTVWIDDLHVEAPDHARIIVAPEPSALVLLGLGMLSLIRRR